MRIYLSGPMTNRPDLNRSAFFAATARLTAQGHFVINPHRISALFGTAEEIANSFEAYYKGAAQTYPNGSFHLAQCVMDADLAAVRSCNAIYLLRGWESSRGAKRELVEALAHGLIVMQEGGEE